MKKGVRIINCAAAVWSMSRRWSTRSFQASSRAPAFDVFVEEPATANVLFRHPNVICTPHLARPPPRRRRTSPWQVAEQMSDYLLSARSPTRSISLDHGGRRLRS